MKKLIEVFVKYKFYANLIIAVLIFAGLYGLSSMKKAYFPEAESRMIQISVTYLGASPDEMEEGITSRIEEALRGIVGIKEITSTSLENMCTISVETTGKIDIDEVLADVKNAVDGVSSLPSGAERPLVYKQRNRSMIMLLSVAGDVDILTLKDIANKVEEDLLNSGKVSQAQIVNPPAVEIAIEVKEDQMQRYRFSFTDIAHAVQMNNRDLSAGQLKSAEEEMVIRLRSKTTNPDILGNIIIRANADGSIIRLRDIARVKKTVSDDYFETKNNGKTALTISVNKLPEEDIEDITEFVDGYIREFNNKNSAVQIDVTFKFLTLLHERIRMLVENGIIGLILVVIGLALFLNWRLSLWVAWGIPSAFLAMFVVASLMGVTINMISLFGMILVIGILVDDGIVIGENIYVHFEQGKSPMRAAIDGTMEVVPAVITSILTTLVAFTPLLLVQGRMEFLQDMAIVVILTLSFSLLEAFFVLPSHLGSKHVLSRKEIKSDKMTPRLLLDKGIAFIRDRVYYKMLLFVIKWRYPMAVVPFAFFLFTIALFKGGHINFTIFPNVSFDNFNVDIAYTPGDGEKQTEQTLLHIEKQLWKLNAQMRKEYGDTADLIRNTVVNIGTAFSGVERGAHSGNVQVIMNNLEVYNLRVGDIINRARKQIGSLANVKKYTIAAQNRFGKPVSISLMSRSNLQMESAVTLLKARLEEDSRLKNIVDNNTLGKKEIVLRLKPQAYMLGFDEVSIASYVRNGFYGYQAQRYQEGRDEIRIWVKYPEDERQTIGQLENVKILTPTGEYRLKELVDFDFQRNPVSIKRYNGRKEVRVEAETVDPDEPLQPVMAMLEEEIPALIESRFPDVDVEFLGQQRDGRESQGQIASLFPLAFLVMLVILMIHFKSWTQSIIVAMMIPLAMLGVVWGHGIHGKILSLFSVFGVVALSGVIINDAVVFLSRFNDLLRHGMLFKQAVLEAGKSRLRPIILTTLTTCTGLFPLILEKSFQAQFLVPMAISLAYGVAIGTFFILLFFPVIIYLLNDLKRFAKWIISGTVPSQEDVEKAVINSRIKIED